MNLPRQTFNERPIYSLSEITKSLQNVVSKNYNKAYYIKAEILKLNFYPHSGHCYPELVEKESGKTKAQLRGVIWASQFRAINERFIKITGEPLKEDVTILCLATVEFSGQHGLALFIQDIEPSFTLGEMSRQKQEVILKLKNEGIFGLNKEKKLALVPKRIAVISVETSKGYSDFTVTLVQNQWKYHFDIKLFPSILQGEKAIVSMPFQLGEIAKRAQDFDCVVIVRGGGGDVGMSCYDDYLLAAAVANFPLPIITGIGHSTNDTVTDMVAFANKITPTEVAYFLLQQFHNFSVKVENAKSAIVKLTQILVKEQNHYFAAVKQKLVFGVEKGHLKHVNCLESIQQKIQNVASQMFVFQKNKLNNLETKIELLHPENILKRGYSITYQDGKALKSAHEIDINAIITTQLYEGKLITKIYKR